MTDSPAWRMVARELRAIVRAAMAEGWSLEAQGAHPKLYTPNRRRFVQVSTTPSDHRTLRNFERDMRRALRDAMAEEAEQKGGRK